MSIENEIIEAIQEASKGGGSFNISSISKKLKSKNTRKKEKSTTTIIQSVIRTLESLNLVISNRKEGAPYQEMTAAPNFPRKNGETASEDGEKSSNNDGGGDDNGPPRNGGNDNQGGGAGFKEVLSHPFLFSLPEEDFDVLLDQIGE